MLRESYLSEREAGSGIVRVQLDRLAKLCLGGRQIILELKGATQAIVNPWIAAVRALQRFVVFHCRGDSGAFSTDQPKPRTYSQRFLVVRLPFQDLIDELRGLAFVA